jgi:predicted regulator of Ras-like GTPase activity (Roadblock/LC7/MglB family)
MKSPFILYEEDITQINELCLTLHQQAITRAVFLVDKDGQLISEQGDTSAIDATALASLTAGVIAAAGGLAKLLGEEEFPVQLHEGARESIHTSLVAERFIFVLIFDERSSLGLVRMKLKRAHSELEALLERLTAQRALPQHRPQTRLFSEISDDDIEALFALPKGPK